MAKPRSTASTARTRTSKVEYRPWHMTPTNTIRQPRVKVNLLQFLCDGPYVAPLAKASAFYSKSNSIQPACLFGNSGVYGVPVRGIRRTVCFCQDAGSLAHS